MTDLELYDKFATDSIKQRMGPSTFARQLKAVTERKNGSWEVTREDILKVWAWSYSWRWFFSTDAHL